MRWVNYRWAVVAAFLLSTSVALAGKYNPTLSIGDAAPAWKDLPGVDGRKHSLDDFKDQSIVVVVFTCNSCDVASDYEERIAALAKKYGGAGGVAAFVAINVNKVDEDSLPKMKERAESRRWPYPYLFDETQQIAKDYGALFTPEFFVLDRERRVRYMGSLDDNSTASVAKQQFLDRAIQAIAAGQQPEPAETPAIGCQIRFDRTRRRPTN